MDDNLKNPWGKPGTQKVSILHLLNKIKFVVVVELIDEKEDILMKDIFEIGAEIKKTDILENVGV